MTEEKKRNPLALSVRPLSCQEDFEAAVALQERIWGADIGETVPACVLQVSQEVGGIADAAFTTEGELVGFVFGLTGPRDGTLAHWSHILAVENTWRNRGVGRLLKDHQRERLLDCGVESMYWTFDPLESRNAHLNLNKLCAKVEKYVPHFYGERAVAMTDTVIGTDRFVVRWDLSENPDTTGPVDLDVNAIHRVVTRHGTRDSTCVPEPPVVSGERVRIEIPADIQSLKSEDPSAAAEWREITRGAFLLFIQAGYHVTAFQSNPNGRGGSYILDASDA